MAELLPAQRHRHIVGEVERQGQVRVAELAAQLSVSEMTVRRDLTFLAGDGILIKVHGGAMKEGSTTSSEPGFATKLGLQTGEKERIAARAAGLVHPGMSLALNSGTTTFALAHHCTSIDDLTVVTNSPRIAQVFYDADNASQTVVLTGGVRTPSDALVGPIALGAVAQLHVDLYIMGVHGMTAEHGFTTPNMQEAHVNREFLRAAGRTAVVADHAKWGVTGLCTIAPLDAVDTVVTDERLPRAAVEHLENTVGEVLIAAPEKASDTPTGSEA
ncbi:DeoR/GlpR family DNA-binding transcription regulator [Zhihengliuella salsuginis]|uniref:DeoR family transcriptional regulator n=1 Tax=Zhihengliuella salsuginis TaxID=578222 RepID=A0ABQ3GHS4_9MICC|nr:DeoR/GlpR family DNA-binding transcription regulator [Zhihengliuella salsuginis]GHD05344.1 DeoR family transcriptional regulator [Zhihengliuella salsuginis]